MEGFEAPTDLYPAFYLQMSDDPVRMLGVGVLVVNLTADLVLRWPEVLQPTRTKEPYISVYVVPLV